MLWVDFDTVLQHVYSHAVQAGPGAEELQPSRSCMNRIANRGVITAAAGAFSLWKDTQVRLVSTQLPAATD